MLPRLALLLIALTGSTLAQIPAFPGAEGFGGHATGGRGGDVYTVTNLNSSGPGSLRYGVENAPSGGRTIVFAVSGYIPISYNSDTRNQTLRIVRDKVTIAGQTAPGDGIGLKDGRILMTGDNCILRNLRVRHGKGGGAGDCLNIDSSAGNSIVDHLSMQFSTDENISFFSSTLDDFTLQYSVSAWGLESHNAGGLWDLEDGSCHHSLWAHHKTRNPKARPYGLLEWVNNVTYDWGIGFIMGDSSTPAPWKANVIGSYFLSPPGYTDGTAIEKARIDRNGNPNFSLHLDDCLHDSDGDGQLDGTDKGYGIVQGSAWVPGNNYNEGDYVYVRADTPFAGAGGNIAIDADDPLTAYKKVVSKAGAVRMSANYSGPLRDEVDTLLFENVVNQVHSRISDENQLPVSNEGFGTLNSTAPPLDSDLDGMPDSWESALGSDPNGQDHNTVFGSTAGTFFPPGTPTGYTYLEEYLHYKSIPHGVLARNTAAKTSSITIDLRKYTGGFADSASFTIGGITNGSVQQFAANGTTPSGSGPVVTFTPTVDFSGRAGFDFTVDDGSSWTQRMALLVTVAALPRDITWTGGLGGNSWDTTTTNWEESGGSPTTFNDGDNALFDDQGNPATIPISGTRSPNSVTVTGSQDYRFSGPGSLAIATSLTKASDTTLTLDTTVTSASGTLLNGGITTINDGGNIAGGPIQFTGGATLNDDTGSDYFTLAPDIEVDAGATGNLELSSRCTLSGSLSGGGTFNIFSPSTLGTEGRAYLDGASAGCTGSVNLSGGATAPGNGGRIAFRALSGNFDGFPSARVNLAGIDLFTQNYSFGNTYSFGELSGDANSRIRGAYNDSGVTALTAGQLGTDSEFAGTISDGMPSATEFSKYGNGTLTLSGANSYSGNTAIWEGELRVTGSLGSTDVFVGDGATLSGSGPMGDLLTAQDGSTISPGDHPGEAGTMNTANGFELKAATMRYDLSGNPASGNDKIENAAGTLTFRSPGGNLGAHFEFNLIDGYLSPGTYTLVEGGSGTSAPGSPAFTHNLPSGTRQSFDLLRSGGGSNDTYVRLLVGGSSSDLTWTGSTTTWDIAGATPWSGGGGGDNRFYNLDRVHFTDSAASRFVEMTGSLEPQLLEVSAGGDPYFFYGTGALTGQALLIKDGDGTMQLANTGTNTYTGGTFIRGGNLTLGSSDVGLGSGAVHLEGGTIALPNTATFLDNSFHATADSAIASTYGGNSTIVDDYAATFSSSGFPTLDLSGVDGILSIKGAMDGFSGTLDFAGGSGMLRLNSGSNGAEDVNFGSAAAHFALGSAGATLTNRNGDKLIELGALSGGPGTHLNGRQSGSGNTSTTYRIGALGIDTCFDGTISNGGDLAGVDLVKVGSGRLCLGGSSDYPGALFVEAGTLAIPGSLGISGSAEVEGGAVLDLDGGTLDAESLRIAPGATLLGPGTLRGELSIEGMLSCTGGTLVLDGRVINDGVVRLTSAALLSTTDTFYNNGVLDLLTAEGEVPANLVNTGIVIDSSGLEITSLGIDGDDFELTMMTYEGHDYQLWWSPDLKPDSWNPTGPVVAGDGTEKPFSDPGGATHGARYYKVVVTP